MCRSHSSMAMRPRQMCFLTLRLKTSWTWLEPEIWKNAHPPLQRWQTSISRLLFSLCVSIFHTQTHTHTRRYRVRARWVYLTLYPYIHFHAWSRLHMPLISTYCCLIYLSKGLTLHLLLQTNPLFHDQMNQRPYTFPPYTLSTNDSFLCVMETVWQQRGPCLLTLLH